MTTLHLPDEIIISNVQIKHNMPSFNTESISLKTRSRDRGLHRIEGSFDVSIQGLKAQKAWTAFMLKLRGRYNTFYLDLPMHFKSDIYRNPTLASPANIGANTINLGGLFTEISAGSCFTMLNDPKTYFVVDDVTRDGVVEIYPTLMKEQLDTSPVEFVAPKITCRLDDQIPTIDYSENGLLVETTINFIEAI
ncbi:hypothetical protein [Vibrio sp. 1249-1]|uniref:hypothetical protein n=1 Tax=Vibrio sp. 1249-1 TaxID=3074547 RepID=UPI002965352C|nr:hypothetical protein [Vibrio sp. 1249-1]MDW2454082.1 hypothetical protein [Vibrio sp. 1249-1]